MIDDFFAAKRRIIFIPFLLFNEGPCGRRRQKEFAKSGARECSGETERQSSSKFSFFNFSYIY